VSNDQSVLSNFDANQSALFQHCESKGVFDIGDMNFICHKCGAFVWCAERVGKKLGSLLVEVSMCCMNGNVTLPLMIEPPALIRNLFSGVDR
ncbi:hypothetical protein A2U01_0037003, partial [Trifolium medium]|nr:hypothetical protein [Trifolium medium]